MQTPNFRTASRLYRLLLTCTLFLATLPHASHGQEYVFRSYRQTQGLDNLSVHALAKDSQGFLWVGTENGLYRYLGSGFQRFGVGQGIPEQAVEDVFAAPDGTFWVGTGENLYRWTGQGFVPAATRALPLVNSGHIAAEAPGSLLVVSHSRLYRLKYDPGSAAVPAAASLFFSSTLSASHPALSRLGGIALHPGGPLWLACARMLCSWDTRGTGASVDKLDKPKGDKPKSEAADSTRRDPDQDGILTQWSKDEAVPEEFYETLFLDVKGSLWVAGERHILELPQAAAGTGKRFIDRSMPESASNGTYGRLPLASDRLGRIISSLHGGIARWDGATWRTIGKANGLVSTHLTAFLFDNTGGLWLGSTGHGLHHWLGYEDWEGWTDRQGLPSSNIWEVGLFDRGRALIGTEKGPAAIDLATGVVTAPFPAKTWKYGQITEMAVDADGTRLASTASGALLRIQENPSRISAVANLQGYLYSFLREPSGRVFVLSDHGVYDVTNLQRLSTVATDPKRDGPVPVAQFAALLRPFSDDIESACVGTGDTAWFVASAGIVSHTFANRQDLWSRAEIQGLPSPTPRLRDITCAPDGSLWVTGNESSVWRLIQRNGHLEASELSLPDDSRSRAIVGLVIDHRGWLWVGTDAGLLAWNGSSWRDLTQESGLIWNDINEPRMALGPDDSVWIGTSGGLSHIIHPEHVFADNPPRIAMVGIRRGTRPLPLAGSLDVAWSRLDISFQFVAPDVLNRTDLAFFYRLDGLNPDWIQTSSDSAHFQSLPPGDYDFEAYAQDRISGVRSSQITIRLHVAPPWWRTKWFYVLCGVAAFLCITLLLHLRTKRLLAQQRRLEKLVQERTSELQASQEKLQVQATHDSLTGLLNRGAILSAFEQAMFRSQREATSITLVLGDIDHFKQVNDTYGHLAGDEALRRFASTLNQSVRPYDFVGRYGGEEFLIVLTGTPTDTPTQRLASLHAAITNIAVHCEAADFNITCSLGAAHIPPGQHYIDGKAILAAADAALYEAKNAGRNRFIVHNLEPRASSTTTA